MKLGGEGDNRGWNGCKASPTWWTWVWASSRSWWWTGKPGMLQSMTLQTLRHYWVTELIWTEESFWFIKILTILFHILYLILPMYDVLLFLTIIFCYLLIMMLYCQNYLICFACMISLFSSEIFSVENFWELGWRGFLKIFFFCFLLSGWNHYKLNSWFGILRDKSVNVSWSYWPIWGLAMVLNF